MGTHARMQLPAERGELSSLLFARLRGQPTSLGRHPHVRQVDDDDFQVSLFVLQQLDFRPIDDVSVEWAEEPSLLALRLDLEHQQERTLRDECAGRACTADEVPDAIVQLLNDAEGPSLSSWMEDNGSIDHLREFALHRAAYQLKEADPHSFAIPRLDAGMAKTALLEIQLDEYGRTEPSEAHAELFRHTLEALGLEAHREDLVDLLPASTLRTNTVLNGFTRSRRTLGACLGHLAVFEMTSVEPMARYAATCRRVLKGDRATTAARFYDVHVAADGLHQRIAIDRLVRGFVEQYPDEATELLFGAAALMRIEAQFSNHLLQSWRDDRTSLRRPLGGSLSDIRVAPAA